MIHPFAQVNVEILQQGAVTQTDKCLSLCGHIKQHHAAQQLKDLCSNTLKGASHAGEEAAPADNIPPQDVPQSHRA